MLSYLFVNVSPILQLTENLWNCIPFELFETKNKLLSTILRYFLCKEVHFFMHIKISLDKEKQKNLPLLLKKNYEI